MYKIRHTAELTGFSPDTLRYYEKIGLLKSPPKSPGGIRTYTDDDVHLLTSIHCLKKTGLSLDDIREFIQDGQCFKNHSHMQDADALETALSRSQILADHLSRMKQQRRELEELIQTTQEKLDYYTTFLNEHTPSE